MNKLIEVLENKEYRAFPISYWGRVIDSFKSMLLFYVIAILVITFLSSFTNALFFLWVLLLMNIVEYRKWTKGYISYIKRDNEKLKINYLLKDKMFHIEDVATSFSFEKKRVWYKIHGAVFFLRVRHNNEVIVKQFMIKDINEAAIDRMVEEFG